MSNKIILVALLLVTSLNCADMHFRTDSQGSDCNNNKGRGSIGHVGDTYESEGDASSDSSSDDGLESEDSIHSIEMRFSDRDLLSLAGMIRTEKAFNAHSEKRQREILELYPEFRIFLQLNDLVGKQLCVSWETCEIYNKRMIVQLVTPIALDDVPEQLRENTIPYVKCTTHQNKNTLHRREINRILAHRKRRQAGVAQQEAPSVAVRIANFVRGTRERLQRD